MSIDSKKVVESIIKKNKGKCSCCGTTSSRFRYLDGFERVLPPVCEWCFANCANLKHTPRKSEMPKLTKPKPIKRDAFFCGSCQFLSVKESRPCNECDIAKVLKKQENSGKEVG